MFSFNVCPGGSAALQCHFFPSIDVVFIFVNFCKFLRRHRKEQTIHSMPFNRTKNDRVGLAGAVLKMRFNTAVQMIRHADNFSTYHLLLDLGILQSAVSKDGFHGLIISLFPSQFQGVRI